MRVDDDTTPEERVSMAKERCGCPQATRERDIREAMDKLEQVCGMTSLDNGFDHAVNDGAMDVCRKAVVWICDMVIRDATIRGMQGDRIMIRGDGKGVKIKRTCQRQLQL